MKPILLALSFLALGSAAYAADTKSEIDAANKKFLAAYAKGDAAAVAALYTDNATVLPPGATLIKGRGEIQKLWQGAIQSGLKLVSLNAVSVQRHGDTAYEIGSVIAEAPDAQKQMTRMEGKYVVVWKKVKGGWKLDTDIWNFNK